MTNHTDAELLPCPFCGCAAHFEMDDDRWEWIECGSCGMEGNRSASLMEDCKPKLAEAWNRRAPAAPVPQEPTSKQVVLGAGALLGQPENTADNRHPDWHSAVAKARSVYLAMLAAAPQPPEAAPVQLPEPAIPGSQGVCCGNFTTGGYYMGQHEQVCCGCPDDAHPPYYTEQQVRELLAAHGIMERST